MSDMTEFNSEQLERIEGAFETIRDAVSQFGRALDADDRYPGAGGALEDEGNADIRGAFTRVPELSQLLPKLSAAVQRGDNLADSGYEIVAEMKLAEALLMPR
jgi:hypothetical protein